MTKLEAMLAAVFIISLVGNVYQLKKRRIPKQRKDVLEIAKAIDDFQKQGGCLIEIRRVNPSDIFIWGNA